MTDSLNGIINHLERQKTAIERALLALREVDDSATAAQDERVTAPESPIHRRRRFSAAFRRKMALAQKARWANVRGQTELPPPAAEPPKPKRRISAEGMKRIIAATKKRWRLQRAAAKSA